MIKTIKIKNPKNFNFILGQSHFIKTVEDIHEALVSSVPNIKFGLAFAEASGPCLIRTSGTDEELIKLAAENLWQIKAGHSFLIFLKDCYPINVLRAVKNVVEVVNIFCATANPVEVVVYCRKQKRGILGVLDGSIPKGIENEQEKNKRREILRQLGYKF